MLDVFTEESGRVRLVAKGARSKRSGLKGALQPFTPLLVRFGGRGEVKTLRSAEAVSLALPFLVSRCTAVSMSTNSSHVFWSMRLASLNFSLITCTVSRRWPALPVRPNLPCVVLNWRCSDTWATGSIFCIVQGAETR